mmetsp:Transcript_50334/g.126778  ORF Transcript_50334/g.126778 Transcript_50334/m.126778 type:complete len:344 (-) Transcript_50334:121-1152(-)
MRSSVPSLYSWALLTGVYDRFKSLPISPSFKMSMCHALPASGCLAMLFMSPDFSKMLMQSWFRILTESIFHSKKSGKISSSTGAGATGSAALASFLSLLSTLGSFLALSLGADAFFAVGFFFGDAAAAGEVPAPVASAATGATGSSLAFRSSRVRARLTEALLMPLPMSRAALSALAPSPARPDASSAAASANWDWAQVGANSAAFCASFSASASWSFSKAFERKISRLPSNIGSAAAAVVSSPPRKSNAFWSFSFRLAGSSARRISYFILQSFFTLLGTSHSASSRTRANVFFQSTTPSTIRFSPEEKASSTLGPFPQRPKHPHSSTSHSPLANSSMSRTKL